MHNCVSSILTLLALSQIIVGCSNNSIDENLQLVNANKIDRNKHSKDAEKIEIKKITLSYFNEKILVCGHFLKIVCFT